MLPCRGDQHHGLNASVTAARLVSRVQVLVATRRRQVSYYIQWSCIMKFVPGDANK